MCSEPKAMDRDLIRILQLHAAKIITTEEARHELGYPTTEET